MAFLTQIQAYIGTFADTASLDAWLTQGAKNIINILPDALLKRYAVSVPVSNSGLATSGYRIYIIHANNYESKEYTADMKARLTDTNSLYYATPTSPAHVFDNALLYIFPNGGTMVALQYPTVSNTDNAIAKFPPELVQAVILYASIQGLLDNINSKISLIDSIVFNSQLPPAPPANPSFTYTNATIGAISPTTIGSLGTAPTYTPPTFTGVQTNINTQLSNADFELATGYINQIGEQLRQYSEDINNNYHSFESSNVAYQANLQVVIQQAQLDQQRLVETARMTTDVNVQNAAKNLEEEVQQYSAILQLYSANLNLYRSNVEQEVQRINSLISKYGAEIPLYVKNYEALKNEYKEILQFNGITQ